MFDTQVESPTSSMSHVTHMCFLSKIHRLEFISECLSKKGSKMKGVPEKVN